MDKILITMFKPEIATAILNSQEKLNPDKNAYIDRNELPGVLDFFGVNDVSKLLTDEAKSIFQNEKPVDTNTNTDVLELTQTTTPAEPEETDIREDNIEDVHTALTEQGSAAFELECITSADMEMSAIGSPYAQQMEILRNLKNERQKAGIDTTNIDEQIYALKKMVEEYMRNHPEASTDRTIVKKISYGRDGNKKALLSQSFGLTGNKAVKPNDTSTETTDTPSDTPSDTSSDISETPTNDTDNNTDAEISYKIDFRTLNPENKGNLHIKGTVNAGSDNSDIHVAALYKKPFNNGGIINFSGNFRQTIENKHDITSVGASLDYNRKNFSTGLFGMYHKEELEETYDKTSRIELYGKYGKSIRAAVGYQSVSGIDYFYTRAHLQGAREFPSSGISINGGIDCEYGRMNIVKATNGSSKNIEFKAHGGLTFKGNGFNANLGGNIARAETKIVYQNMGFSNIKTTASLFGKLDTENFDLSTTISSINTRLLNHSTQNSDNVLDKNGSITTSITLGIKKLFGDNVMPTFSYNTGNYDGANKNITVGVVIIP